MKYQEIVESGKIGPHSGKEIDLVLSRKKPIAMMYWNDILSHPRYEEINKELEQGKLIIKKIKVFNKTTSYLIGEPNQYQNMLEIEAIYKAANAGKYFDEKRLGQLLGYSDADINAYLKQVA